MNDEPLSDRPNRRTLLASIGAIGTVGLAGCAGDGGESEPTETATPTPAETEAPWTPTETASAMPAGHDYYVATDGSDDDPGTREAPLATIGAAVGKVTGGDSVYVDSGEYQEYLEIYTGGTADQPIEITGPADAVLRRRADEKVAMIIGGEHVHLTGLTITGLSDPARPEDVEAYADAPLVLFTAKPPFDSLNRGGVFAPHRVGNSGAQLVKFRFCRDAEAGPFRVTGRAGAAWQLSDGGHPSGEIVYVGTSPSTIEKTDAVNRWDDTRNVRVHHVDNSAGTPTTSWSTSSPGPRTSPSSTVPTSAPTTTRTGPPGRSPSAATPRRSAGTDCRTAGTTVSASEPATTTSPRTNSRSVPARATRSTATKSPASAIRRSISRTSPTALDRRPRIRRSSVATLSTGPPTANRGRPAARTSRKQTRSVIPAATAPGPDPPVPTRALP